MQGHVMRLKMIFKPMGIVSQVVNDICSWENKWYSLAALIIYNAAVWNFQPYMVPLGMIIGILVCMQNSKNPYLLDALSSVKCAVGLGASNLGPMLSSETILSSKGRYGSDDDGSSTPSEDYEAEVLLTNEILSCFPEGVH